MRAYQERVRCKINLIVEYFMNRPSKGKRKKEKLYNCNSAFGRTMMYLRS